MKRAIVCLTCFLSCVFTVLPCATQQVANTVPPTFDNPKAQKNFASAEQWQKMRNYAAAIEDYRKADVQEGGRCLECERRVFNLALETRDYESAERAARAMIAVANTPPAKAAAHYLLGVALQRRGVDSRKPKCFADSCDELKAALDSAPNFAYAHFNLGVSLAHLQQDDAARREFASYLAQDKTESDLRTRATRYIENVELARAKMAPPFSLTTLDGKHVSLDALTGKVVLLDFWATWCGPCREALPSIQRIARKYQDQPLVILSVSLDDDEKKWRDFVAKNNMNWLQTRDGRSAGPIAKEFGVNAIPATFTIDADGVIQDQHVGDADLEGKLKKMLARAQERAAARSSADSAQ